LTEESRTQRAAVTELRDQNAALESKLAAESGRQKEILQDLSRKDAELVEQTRAIEELTRRQSDLQASLAASEKNVSGSSARAEQLESELNLARKEAEAVRQAKTSMESVLQGSQREIGSLQDRIRAAQADLAAAQDRQQKLVAEIESHKKSSLETRTALNSEVQRASAEAAKLREAARTAEETVRSLQQAQNASLQEINALRTEKERLSAQNDGQKSLLERAESAWKEKFAQTENVWKSKVDELSARLAKIGSGVNAAREESERYRKELQESKLREAQAQAERIQLNTEIAKSDAQIRRERQERDSVTSALTQAQKAHASAQAELARLNTEVSRLSSGVEQNSGARIALERENQTLKQSQAAAQTQLQTLQVSKADIEKSLKAAQASEAAARAEAQKAQAAMAALQADRTQLEADAVEAVQGVSKQSEVRIEQLNLELAKSKEAFKLLESELESSSESLAERQAQTQKLEQALQQNRESIAQFESVRRDLSGRLNAAEERAKKLEAEVTRLAAEAAKPAAETAETQKMRADLKALQARLSESSAVEKSLQTELALAHRAAEQASGRGSRELPQLRDKINSLESERNKLIEEHKKSEAQKVQLAAQVEELKKTLGQAAVAYKQQSVVQAGLRKKLEITAKNSPTAQPVVPTAPAPALTASAAGNPQGAVETSETMSPIGRLSAIRALKIMRTDPELMKQNQAPLKPRATATLIISRPENDYLLVSMDHIQGLKEGSKLTLSVDNAPIYDAEVRKAGDYDMMTLKITKRHVDAADFDKGQIFEAKEI